MQVELFKSRSENAIRDAINAWLNSQSGAITVLLPSLAVCGVSDNEVGRGKIVTEYHIAIWYEKKS